MKRLYVKIGTSYLAFLCLLVPTPCLGQVTLSGGKYTIRARWRPGSSFVYELRAQPEIQGRSSLYVKKLEVRKESNGVGTVDVYEGLATLGEVPMMSRKPQTFLFDSFYKERSTPSKLWLGVISPQFDAKPLGVGDSWTLHVSGKALPLFVGTAKYTLTGTDDLHGRKVVVLQVRSQFRAHGGVTDEIATEAKIWISMGEGMIEKIESEMRYGGIDPRTHKLVFSHEGSRTTFERTK